MRHAVVLLSGLLSGCSASFDDKGSAGSGTTNSNSPFEDANASGGSGSGDDDGTGGDSESRVEDLEDLKAAINASAEGCQEVDEIPHPGAASYFYGEVEPIDTEDGTARWRGSEEWLLYSNDAWRDTGVSDCTITWSIQAEETDPGSCAACTLTIAVSATVDLARTSCPEGLWEDDANYTESYDVQLNDDGSSTWFFARTGTFMGTGSWEGSAMNYLTERTCVWF